MSAIKSEARRQPGVTKNYKLNGAQYNVAELLQASMAVRLNRVASIAELMPTVLSKTLAQGTYRHPTV